MRRILGNTRIAGEPRNSPEKPRNSAIFHLLSREIGAKFGYTGLYIYNWEGGFLTKIMEISMRPG